MTSTRGVELEIETRRGEGGRASDRGKLIIYIIGPYNYGFLSIKLGEVLSITDYFEKKNVDLTC